MTPQRAEAERLAERAHDCIEGCNECVVEQVKAIESALLSAEQRGREAGLREALQAGWEIIMALAADPTGKEGTLDG